MRFEAEVHGQKLVGAPVAELDELLALSAEDIKAGKGYPCVVDVRKKMEASVAPAAKCKELGISYQHVPVTLESYSEQDMDHLRREFARKWGRVLVISAGGERASFLVLSHAARALSWKGEEALEKCPPRWRGKLDAYLHRHAPA